MIKLDGKLLAIKKRDEIKQEIEELKEKTGKTPGLAIVLIGNNPASKIYVNSKVKGCEELGIKSFVHYLDENITEDEVLKVIDDLNKDEMINGILVQLPLPKHISEKKVIEKIALDKDVDGFKPENLGLLLLGDKDAMIPCTPAGIMEIFKEYAIKLEGKDAVVIGRSNIVGKPMAALLTNAGATVTVCHSKTKDLKEKSLSADIVVVAIGQAKFLNEKMIKDGAIIIDVGINRTAEGLFGDVDYEAVKEKVSYITPVPGGVGPMTVTMLFYNTLKAFKRSNKIN